MAKIQINRTSPQSTQNAFTKIKSLFENDPDLKRIDSNYKCQFDDAACTGTAKGKMFDAQLRVSANGTGSSVDLTVTLPLMVSPLKGTIEKTLSAKLEKALA